MKITAGRRTVVALLVALGFATGVAAAPVAAADSVAPISCTTKQFHASGKFEITFDNVDFSKRTFCEYQSQYDWLKGIHDGVLRGVLQSSGYTDIVATDNSTKQTAGASVRGSFCTKPHARCGVTTSVPGPGPDYPKFHVIEQEPCQLFPPEAKRDFYSSETYALRRLMEDTGKIHFDNLAYFQVISGSGNTITDGTKCAV